MRYLLALLALVSTCAYAQAATVTGKADYKWSNPTTGQPGNVPLTGSDALTKVQAWVKTAPIADTDTSAPTAELAATATTFTFTTTVPNGSTLYGRFKACTANACSAFSASVSKLVTVVVPDVPFGVSVTVTVTVTTP